jgi:DNA repair protein RadC
MKIYDIHQAERPREKIINRGVEQLSNSELLAVLLRTGIKGLNAIQLGRKIEDVITSKGFENLTLNDLINIKGLGKAKAAEILACFEIGKRFLLKKNRHIMYKPKDVWNALTDIRSSKKEQFVVFFLDAKNEEIIREIISIGTLTASLVHPREVFEPAIKRNAASIILAHNHPSGNLDPSDADIEVTEKLIQGGKLLGISVIDHVIVTAQGYQSIKEGHEDLF